jgi:hypothetical protein
MVKRLVVAVFAAMMLTLWVSSAGATQGGSASFGPQAWAVPAACGLTGVTTVTLTGTMRWNQDGSGATHTTVNGRATDNLGNNYVFNYRNNYKGDPTLATGPTHMIDHFNLVGNGPADKLQAGFNLFVAADGSWTFKTERNGSLTLGCDPL